MHTARFTKSGIMRISTDFRRSALQCFLLLCVGIALSAAGTAQAGGEPLHVQSAWIREAPPTAKALGGFMVLHNMSRRERVLQGAESPVFSRVMIHQTVEQAGLAQMRHLATVTLAPGQSLAFEPGGYHLMLMQPVRPLVAGDEVPVVLHFADGMRQTVTFTVRRDAAQARPHAH